VAKELQTGSRKIAQSSAKAVEIFVISDFPSLSVSDDGGRRNKVAPASNVLAES